MDGVFRGYSAIKVREMDAKRRTITGVATTPTLDRMGDTVDPLGATFAKSIPLLYQHRHASPVGRVSLGAPTKHGIPFAAELPVVDEPPALKDRVDLAWGEVQHGLISAVSIGFRPIKYAFRDDGGVDFLESEIYELSLVTIPANAEAVISAIKAFRPFSIDAVSAIAALHREDGAVRIQKRQAVSPMRRDPSGAVFLRR